MVEHTVCSPFGFGWPNNQMEPDKTQSPRSKDTQSLFEMVGILCLYFFPADLVNGCERIEWSHEAELRKGLITKTGIRMICTRTTYYTGMICTRQFLQTTLGTTTGYCWTLDVIAWNSQRGGDLARVFYERTSLLGDKTRKRRRGWKRSYLEWRHQFCFHNGVLHIADGNDTGSPKYWKFRIIKRHEMRSQSFYHSYSAL